MTACFTDMIIPVVKKIIAKNYKSLSPFRNLADTISLHASVLQLAFEPRYYVEIEERATFVRVAFVRFDAVVEVSQLLFEVARIYVVKPFEERYEHLCTPCMSFILMIKV